MEYDRTSDPDAGTRATGMEEEREMLEQVPG
jgi:hypothetical protein